MSIWSYEPAGFDGNLVAVEADIRRGIPGTVIVGLPGCAVREARERVRVALKNSGFEYPAARILINLAPGSIPKSGTLFDLPIALALLSASGQFGIPNGIKVLVMGEILLSGRIRGVRGILPAVAEGLKSGINHFIIPEDNRKEASVLGQGLIGGVSSLTDAAALSVALTRSNGTDSAEGWIDASKAGQNNKVYLYQDYPDFSDLKGQTGVKRALEIAAAGRHNVLLFGPPGCGKTMAGFRFPGILPALSRQESLEVSRIHSLAGLIPQEGGLICRPPYRSPHHSASSEGIAGGGTAMRPGEISLAHKGVLFLDEAPEFRKNILQNLREPLEYGSISIARAGRSFRFPADFQLLLSANPCPCGNLGRSDNLCVCSMNEVNIYWKRIGGALMDRIDIRVPLLPPSSESLFKNTSENTESIKTRVEKAVRVQTERYRKEIFKRNGKISPGKLNYYCPLTDSAVKMLNDTVRLMDLSARAVSSIMKISRTIADFEQADSIDASHVLEAAQYRRHGDVKKIWETLNQLSSPLPVS
jgi:magnesium chelatase family protein